MHRVRATRVVHLAVTLSCCPVALVACGARQGPLPDGGVDAAAPVGDLGPCAPDPEGLAGCFVGTTFASCPGPVAPKLLCAPRRCLWFSDGKPRGAYQTPMNTANCPCQGKSCPPDEVARAMSQFRYSYGDAPWSRARALVLPATIDPVVVAAGNTRTCRGCDAECHAGDNPCFGERVDIVQRQLPGTFMAMVGATSFLNGWVLEVEVDLALGKARACRVRGSDSQDCTPHEPLCATSGSVALSETPCRTRLEKVRLHYELRFADGLTMEGTF